MNDLEFKKQILDTKSASFCGAKWYNATIWLGSGMSTSCHHPPAHKVDIEEVKRNPKAIHNTPEKKQDRAQMQAGERPPGCEYCWKIEDIKRDNISDRVYKSKIYTIKELDDAYQSDATSDVDLRTLEISFDRTFNLLAVIATLLLVVHGLRISNQMEVILGSFLMGVIILPMLMTVRSCTNSARKILMLRRSSSGGNQTYTER